MTKWKESLGLKHLTLPGGVGTHTFNLRPWETEVRVIQERFS